ncbi:MAG: phage replication initiation protein, NGO0469 family, partial [Chitinophagaceae bacterium]
MPIIAKETGGKDFKKVPPGAHFAICNMVVDCGLQEGFSGKPQHKVYLRWEVPDERVSYEKDGQSIEGPCSIGCLYTLSLSEKANLRKTLENWRGKPFTADELAGFDITTVLGKACQIMVTHETKANKTYANVTGVMGISKDQRDRAKNAKPENTLLAYSLDGPDAGVFSQL